MLYAEKLEPRVVEARDFGQEKGKGGDQKRHGEGSVFCWLWPVVVHTERNLSRERKMPENRQSGLSCKGSALLIALFF